MKRIGIDVDGVIANISNEISHRLKRDGFSHDLSLWKKYLLEENHPQVDEQWMLTQFKDPTFWLNAIPFKDAWHVLNNWFMNNIDIYLLTCRPSEYSKDVTYRWLDEWFINYNNIIFDIPKNQKHEYLQKLNISLFIEDNPVEAKIAAKTTETYLMDRPYNKRYKIGHAKRISSMHEIEKKVFADAKVEVQ